METVRANFEQTCHSHSDISQERFPNYRTESEHHHLGLETSRRAFLEREHSCEAQLRNRNKKR